RDTKSRRSLLRSLRFGYRSLNRTVCFTALQSSFVHRIAPRRRARSGCDESGCDGRVVESTSVVKYKSRLTSPQSKAGGESWQQEPPPQEQQLPMRSKRPVYWCGWRRKNSPRFWHEQKIRWWWSSKAVSSRANFST